MATVCYNFMLAAVEIPGSGGIIADQLVAVFLARYSLDRLECNVTQQSRRRRLPERNVEVPDVRHVAQSNQYYGVLDAVVVALV